MPEAFLLVSVDGPRSGKEASQKLRSVIGEVYVKQEKAETIGANRSF